MKYKAVIFDLFGTLVDSLKRQEYDRVNARMAEMLGIPFGEFWRLLAETGHDYYLGNHESFEDHLQDICLKWGLKADPTRLKEAAKPHYEFLGTAIIPSQEVMDAVRELRNRGFRIGLITNCGAAVPLQWQQSPLAKLIDAAVFSCRDHVMKPDVRCYQIAAQRIQVQPEQCIYIGDGSYQELTHAAEVGMLPVLKRTDLSDVYDQDRPEVESWSGLRIDTIGELIVLINRLEAKRGV